MEIASYKNYHGIDDLFKDIKALSLATFENWSSPCLRVPQQQQSKKGNKLVLKLTDTKEKGCHTVWITQDHKLPSSISWQANVAYLQRELGVGRTEENCISSETKPNISQQLQKTGTNYSNVHKTLVNLHNVIFALYIILFHYDKVCWVQLQEMLCIMQATMHFGGLSHNKTNVTDS